MKKYIITLAIAVVSLNASAFHARQDDNKQKPRQEQRQGDMVVNIKTMESLNLSEKQLNQIKELQQKKSEEMKSMREERKDTKEKKSEEAKEERKAQMEKMQAFKADYRKDVRKILGDDKYIEYLEKQVDQQGMQRQGMRQNQRRGPQGGPGAPGEGNGAPQNGNFGGPQD